MLDIQSIKFRGKRVDTNDYIYSQSIKVEYDVEINNDPCYLLRDNDLQWWEVQPNSIAQFVGYDRHNKPIYSNDYIKVIAEDWDGRDVVETHYNASDLYIRLEEIGNHFKHIEIVRSGNND